MVRGLALGTETGKLTTARRKAGAESFSAEGASGVRNLGRTPKPRGS